MAVQELEVDALVKAGIFHSRGEAVEEALSLMFATRPHLRVEAAIQLLKDGAVTMGRAAEIAGVTRWEFEDLLANHGIELTVTCDPAEELDRQPESRSQMD
jgi:predicted HTH domain antitoxin